MNTRSFGAAILGWLSLALFACAPIAAVSQPVQWNYTVDAAGNATATYPGNTIVNGDQANNSNSVVGPFLQGSVRPLPRALPRTMAMYARVKANQGNGIIALTGDSETFGTGAQTRSLDYNHLICNELVADGIPCEQDSIWGLATFTYAGLAAYNNQITFAGTGLGAGATSVSLAGNMFNMTASGDTINYTTEKVVNQFDIWYPCWGSQGTISVGIDGNTTVQSFNLATGGGVLAWSGTAWTVTTAGVACSNSSNPNGNFNVLHMNLAGAVAIHTLNIKWVSGNCDFSGIHGYRSDYSQVGIFNWGVPGGTAINVATGGSIWNYPNIIYGPLAGIPVDLNVIELGNNDAKVIGNTETVAQYQAAMQTYITAAQQAGPNGAGSHDVAMIISPAMGVNPPQGLATANVQNSLWLIQANTLSPLNLVPILAHMPKRWNMYAGGQAIGMYANSTGDTIHPGSTGYADQAHALIRATLPN